MTVRTWGMRLRLEGRGDKNSNWGVYSTAMVEQSGANDTLDRAYDRAVSELDVMRNRWLANFDPTIEFRIVS